MGGEQESMKEMKYWGTPPELYRKLDLEFHFDHDPCPAQSHELLEWDGLGGTWGQSNYVNPPYTRKNGGTMAWVRKAIEEHKKGRSSVLILPTRSFVNELLNAGADLRSAGRVDWRSLVDGSSIPRPNTCTLFILRNNGTKT